MNSIITVENLPSLSEYIYDLGPTPQEALILGMCQDGLPLCLNLHDPTPQSVLIVANKGKTRFLKSIAKSITLTQTPQDVQYGVVTRHPEEWERSEEGHEVGIFPTYHTSSDDFILSLASWAHGNKSNRQSVVLLLDNLEDVTEFNTIQNLRWLLINGAKRRVWVFATSNKDHEPFRVKIHNDGGQFRIKQEKTRINFWVLQ